MKILKTLAVFFVLLALTAGAVAEEVEITKFQKGEVSISLPLGVKTVNSDYMPEDGVIEIEIDSLGTDWSTAITKVASDGDLWFGFNWDVPAGKLSSGSWYWVTTESDDWSNSQAIKDACEELRGLLINYSSREKAGYAGGTLISYFAETNKVVPYTFAETKSCIVMGVIYGYDDETDKYVPETCKYATVKLTHTNNNEFTARLNRVPKERIVADANVDESKAVVVDGSVVYSLDNDHGYGALVTRVAKPTNIDAKSVMVSGGGVVSSGTVADQEYTFYGLGTEEWAKTASLVYYWYSGEYDAEGGVPTGDLLYAERLDISVMVGDPKPWPNYISVEGVSKANATHVISKDKGLTAESFISTDYNEENGTVLIAPNGKIPANKGDLTEYKVVSRIVAPEDAVKCATYNLSYSEALGSSSTERNYASMDGLLTDKAREDVPENGVYVYEEDLFRAIKFDGDDGLEVYYDRNSSGERNVDVMMIDWFDGLGNRIERQWFCRQYKEMVTPETEEILNVEPTSADSPVLITTADIGDYKLQVSSYPQTSRYGTQIHYELQLLDPNGYAAQIGDLPEGTQVQLLIPYPDNVDLDNVVFTVNHYDAVTKVDDENKGEDEEVSVAESYAEGVTLDRTDAGVLMTVKSLSPFVLSYVKSVCNHDNNKNLTYDAMGNTITETCPDCEHKETLTVEVEESCVAGTQISYKITTSAGWQGGEPTIEYGNEETLDITSEMPKEPGKYVLFVKVQNRTLAFQFKVVAAPAMPATGDNSLPLIALMGMLALAVTGSFMLRKKANG